MINFNALPLCDVLPILLRGLKIKTLPKPRALKSDAEKISRTRTNAEVFTPSRIVKQMVDAIDDGNIDSRWLEIACGEAPFITNRYDAESGELIPFDARAGVLNKKIRAAGKSDVKRAVQSVYGYELQDDSLLIARANVLLTAADYADFSENDLAELAEIIAWNFFQLDGTQDNGFFAPTIIDWRDGRKFTFGGNTMKKFDFVIGNPPYQDETEGSGGNFASPVYDKFMEAAYKIGKTVELITPARFLFNAGATSKDFNQRMLSDPHLKVLDYAPDARKYFKGVDIKGGVAITLHDEDRDFGAIGTFIAFDELKTIHQKVCVDNPNFRPLSDIIFGQTIYRLTKKFHEDNPDAVNKISKGHANDFSTVLMKRFSRLFFDDKPKDEHEYIQVYGRIGTKRVCKWFRRDWVNAPAPLDKWKVLIPKANGTGALGEVIPTPLVGSPLVGSPLVGNTETFITVGAFASEAEALACIAYIVGKFCRAMLGVLKVTQEATPDKWAKVPLEDFTSESDIDWRGDVDAQLYRKYGLTAEEIDFIETHVKEMN